MAQPPNITTFPKYVIFQSLSMVRGGKYLRYVTEGNSVARHGYIQLDSDDPVSPYTRFEIEAANRGGGLVHIKSCYNNKYWAKVSASTARPQYLAAWADHPDEDLSKWTCTLFRFETWGAGSILCHGQTGLYATYRTSHGSMGLYCLNLDWRDREGIIKFIDWESLTILPRNVAFKGVASGRYLGVKVAQRQNYLAEFGTEIAQSSVAHQSFNSAADGSVRIKSTAFDRFWRHSGNNYDPWVVADAAQSNNNRDTLFQPVVVGEDTVAIRSSATHLFLAKQRRGDYILADMKSPEKSTIYKVEEPILSRTMYDVSYRRSEATIYNEEPIVMVSADVSNASTEVETLTITLSFTEETTRSFSNSVSAGMNLKTSFKAGYPFIYKGKVEMSASANYTHNWGQTKTLSGTLTRVVQVNVAPGTRVRARVLATQGTCHVPFSYTYRDVLTNGVPVPYTMYDGIYTCTNFYNVYPVTDDAEPLELVDKISQLTTC